MRTFDTVPPVGRLIEDYLLRKREQEGKRKVAGGRRWRASRLGSCLRAQWLEAVEEREPLVTLKARSLKRYSVGDVWNDTFKRWFDDMHLLIHEEYALSDAELNVGGHVDFIIGNEKIIGLMQEGDFPPPVWRCGIEIKSVHSTYFKYREREDGMETATPSMMVQAATYDVLSRRMGVEMPWVVVCVSKDDLMMGQTVVTEKWRTMALERIQLLNQCLAAGTPPPCECKMEQGLWGGREWRFCDYYAGSQESAETPHKEKVEGEFYKNGKPKYRTVYHPDGECCQV